MKTKTASNKNDRFFKDVTRLIKLTENPEFIKRVVEKVGDCVKLVNEDRQEEERNPFYDTFSTGHLFWNRLTGEIATILDDRKSRATLGLEWLHLFSVQVAPSGLSIKSVGFWGVSWYESYNLFVEDNDKFVNLTMKGGDRVDFIHDNEEFVSTSLDSEFYLSLEEVAPLVAELLEARVTAYFLPTEDDKEFWGGLVPLDSLQQRMMVRWVVETALICGSLTPATVSESYSDTFYVYYNQIWDGQAIRPSAKSLLGDTLSELVSEVVNDYLNFAKDFREHLYEENGIRNPFQRFKIVLPFLAAASGLDVLEFRERLFDRSVEILQETCKSTTHPGEDFYYQLEIIGRLWDEKRWSFDGELVQTIRSFCSEFYLDHNRLSDRSLLLLSLLTDTIRIEFRETELEYIQKPKDLLIEILSDFENVRVLPISYNRSTLTLSAPALELIKTLPKAEVDSEAIPLLEQIKTVIPPWGDRLTEFGL